VNCPKCGARSPKGRLLRIVRIRRTATGPGVCQSWRRRPRTRDGLLCCLWGGSGRAALAPAPSGAGGMGENRRLLFIGGGRPRSWQRRGPLVRIPVRRRQWRHRNGSPTAASTTTRTTTPGGTRTGHRRVAFAGTQHNFAITRDNHNRHSFSITRDRHWNHPTRRTSTPAASPTATRTSAPAATATLAGHGNPGRPRQRLYPRHQHNPRRPALRSTHTDAAAGRGRFGRRLREILGEPARSAGSGASHVRGDGRLSTSRRQTAPGATR